MQKVKHLARKQKERKNQTETIPVSTTQSVSVVPTQQSDNSSQPCEQTTTNVLQKIRNRGQRKNTRRCLDNVMIARQNLDSIVENTIEEYNVGNRTHTCTVWGASMFTGETSKGTCTGTNPTAKFSLCCGYGAIKLPPINEPPGS